MPRIAALVVFRHNLVICKVSKAIETFKLSVIHVCCYDTVKTKAQRDKQVTLEIYTKKSKYNLYPHVNTKKWLSEDLESTYDKYQLSFKIKF